MTKTTIYEARSKKYHVQLEETKNLQTGTLVTEITVFDMEDSQHLVFQMELGDFDKVHSLLAEIIKARVEELD